MPSRRDKKKQRSAKSKSTPMPQMSELQQNVIALVGAADRGDLAAVYALLHKQSASRNSGGVGNNDGTGDSNCNCNSSNGQQNVSKSGGGGGGNGISDDRKPATPGVDGHGHGDGVAAFVNTGYPIPLKLKPPFNFGSPALLYAARSGHVGVVKALLERKANVNKVCVCVRVWLDAMSVWNSNSQWQARYVPPRPYQCQSQVKSSQVESSRNAHVHVVTCVQAHAKVSSNGNAQSKEEF